MKPWELTYHIDIETFPRLGFYWDDNRPYNILRQIEDTAICCFSAKQHKGPQITKALPDYKGYKPGSRDDKKLVQDIWNVLDKAEVIVAHNGKAFDTKLITARFTYHNMRPPSPYRVVDTLTQARQIGRYDSNRLKYLGKYFKVGDKLRTGGDDLWFDCMAGDKAAWAHMKRYNAQDVIVLERIYDRLLPYMKNHPNLANGYGPHLCPRCGGTNITKQGIRRLVTTAYQQYKCTSCGSWLRDNANAIAKDDRPFVAI